MRVLIVDDEANARNRLQIMLEELDVEVVGEAANGVEALDMVGRLAPDLLLLDINMPEVDGFDVVRHLPESGPMVVFQTAHDEFALKAFDHEAVDYLVKPVNLGRLSAAVERARRRMGQSSRGYPPQLIEQLREAIGGGSLPGPRRVLVRDGRGHRLLPLEQIRRFAAREGDVYAVTPEREFMTDYTLSELENRFAGSFTRSSRAELVALLHVHRFVSDGDAGAELVLLDGTRVRVSRRRVADVRRRLEELG